MRDLICAYVKIDYRICHRLALTRVSILVCEYSVLSSRALNFNSMSVIICRRYLLSADAGKFFQAFSNLGTFPFKTGHCFPFIAHTSQSTDARFLLVNVVREVDEDDACYIA